MAFQHVKMNVALLSLVLLSLSALPYFRAQSPNGGKRALKILLLSPKIGYSHLQYIGSVADTLADAGHQVVGWSHTDIVWGIGPLQHILELHFYKEWRNFTQYRHQHRVVRVPSQPGDIEDVRQIKMFTKMFDGEFNALFDGIWSEFFDHSRVIANNDAVLEQLTQEHFDVGFAELYDYCALGILHRIGVRSVVASFALPLSQLVASHFGVPAIPSYMTSLMAPVKNGPTLGFGERMLNFWYRVYEKTVLKDKMYAKQQIMLNRKYGAQFPHLMQLVKNVSFMFLNNFEQYELPKPSAPKIVYIGGIVEANQPVRQMDNRSAQIFSRTRKGVVYFSLGSIADLDLLPPALAHSFAHTFRQFPEYDFIWKMDSARPEKRAQFDAMHNVHMLSWVNQRAVLDHPRLRAFITHCGRNSLNEAAIHGVPLVAVPLFCDQPYNAMTARYKGVGEFVDIGQLAQNPHLLAEALQKVLNDQKYKRNALTLKRQIALAPFSGAQKLVRHIEFAAEFPGTGLADLNLPTEEDLGGYFVYHSLDVMLATVCLVCALLLLAVAVAKCLLAGIVRICQIPEKSDKKNL